MSDISTALFVGLTVPFLGTALGSSFAFLLKGKMNTGVEKSLLGFASGVMVAASVWSLIMPAVEMAESSYGPVFSIVPAVVGFLAGMGFLLWLDTVTPHLHAHASKPEGPRSQLSRTAMLSLAVTIHNLPEGMAVGVVLAGLIDGSQDITAASVMAISIGIAIQNIPEGAIISMPMRAAGNPRLKAFGYGTLSGIVEPIGAALIIALSGFLRPVLPYMLTFAAGAMLYVVIEELIPEASRGEHSNLGTIGFAIGFALMMALDIALG